jgi:hypothetical protein
MIRSFTIHTADGGKVAVTPVDSGYDLNVQDAKGETTATVTMSVDDFAALRERMEVAA